MKQVSRVSFLFLIVCLCVPALFAATARIAHPVKSDINVRVDSTPMSEVIGTLQKSDEVQIVEERYGWCRVRLPKKFICYVAAEFLENMGDGKGRVSASLLNVRSQPGVDSYVLGTVRKGDVLSIIERVDGWYKVIGYPYVLGWVHRNLLALLPRARLVHQEGVILYLKAQRECPANCLLKSDQKYPLRISSPHHQKFINKKVRIIGRRVRGTCDYVVVKKLSFKR
ncbi:MAG: SH3 domain-containing protein [Candidatus Omnitrophica bacterium]|nr:SH3 domain-containing protein [Candidatus Omnitrophota bacterium]